MHAMDRRQPDVAGIAGSGHGTVTSVRRLPLSWRRPSTTALNVRSQEWWKGVRERCTRSTAPHGDRSHLSQGRGQSSCLKLWGHGLERAACPRSRVPHLTPVVMVQEASHDDATTAFLISNRVCWWHVAKGRGHDVEREEEEEEKRRKPRRMPWCPFSCSS